MPSSKPRTTPGISPRGRRPDESWRAYRKRRRSFFWRWRRPFFLLSLILLSGIAAAGYWLASIELPPANAQPETTFVYDVNGDLLAEFHSEEDRVLVRLDQVPEVMINAVIAAEDRDFFSHPGVDPVGIARAAYADIQNRQFEQGGSTITQQLVKNRFLSNERTLMRKIREAVLAIRLEQDRDKTDILEDYLNTIYFGRGAYGVQAASRSYFGLDAQDLGLRESAYLAGLIRAPEAADTDRDPTAADGRRDQVLGAIREEGYITAGELAAAKAQPVSGYTIRRVDNNSVEVHAGAEIGSQYFVDYVLSQLNSRYGDAVVFGGGLRVYTSIDMNAQKHAFDAVHEVLDREDDPEAGLVAVDEQGLIRAMYGGDSWPDSKVNLAVGRDGGGSGRQPGSSFKPLVLAEFLNQGYSISSKFNSPNKVRIKIPGQEDWEPSNYGNSSFGVIDLKTATKNSVNTAYAQVMEEVGPDKAVEMAKKLGIRSDIPEVYSLVLGGGEVSVLDMASAYATFMRRGVAVEPRAILRVDDASGNVIDNFDPESKEVISQDISDTVTGALQEVVRGGTGTRARLRLHHAAGKTGTTNDNKDAWFVGYTPKLSAAVWMGFAFPDPETGEIPIMRNVHGRRVTGGSFPAQIWRVFMERTLEGVDTGNFPSTPRPFGEILNRRLTVPTSPPTTQTTLPPCGAEEDPAAGSCQVTTTTTTEPGGSTTTTVPGASTTTTTAPGGSTTTTTAGGTTTTTAPPSSTTTTVPGSSTTTTDPPPPVPDG